jgi:uncharacterized membrane protein
MNTREHSTYVSVPPGEGVRVDKAVTIERPIAEVYNFWRHLENFPRFMRHVKEVTRQDDTHSHWAVRTVGGKVVEWDAEIIEQRENELISWRSTPGAEVDNAGSVQFTSVPGGLGTLVRVELKYVPPAGKTGVLIAKAFGRDAGAEIEEDLGRLKILLETGHLPPPRAKLKAASDKVQRSVKAINVWQHEHPVAALGICALAGFAAALLVAPALFGKQRERLFAKLPRRKKSLIKRVTPMVGMVASEILRRRRSRRWAQRLGRISRQFDAPR